MSREVMDAHAHTLILDGLEVHLYRSDIDGRLVVDIDSGCVGEHDQFENAVPRLVVYINECRDELRADGSWCRTT